MRLVVVGALLLVVGLGPLIVGGTSQSNRVETVQAAVEPAPPADPYGAPLKGGDRPAAAPASPVGGPAAAPVTAATPTNTTGGEAPTTPSTSLVVDPSAVGEGTTLVDDETEYVHEGGSYSEEEPDDEFPGSGEGEFPISSNLPDGTDYPLADMVNLAVDLLSAETTGQGRDRYPHLADQVSVCCVDFVVDGAVVLFGPSHPDPATIIVEWHALDAAEHAAWMEVARLLLNLDETVTKG